MTVHTNRTFPWQGRIKPWSATLRSLPRKTAEGSSRRVLADLPRGTLVTVVGHQGGWLHVHAMLGGDRKEGYLSQELIEDLSAETPSELSEEPAAPVTAPAQKRRLFFAIYYRVKDQAFKRAAETWERETRRMFQFRDTVDLFLSIEVGSESEFKTAWRRVSTESKGKFATVVQGQVFSHASKNSHGMQNGLEFTKDGGEDGTVMRAEIEALAPLDWDPKEGQLLLSGCNSGLKGNRQWAPAEIFARSQKVLTVGQSGYAYFSTDPSTYKELGSDSTTAYLWAFKRMRNGWSGGGERMQGVLFTP